MTNKIKQPSITKQIKKPFVAVAAFALAGNLPAAVVLSSDGSTSFGANSNTLTGSFDASNSDKLVVVVTGEHGFPNNLGGEASSVTYDGVEMTPVIVRSPVEGAYGVDGAGNPINDQIFNTIWYLDNPSTSTGTIVASVATRGSVTAIGLDGTALGFSGATAVSVPQTSTVDLTTTAPGSFVISSFGVGGNGNTGQTDGVDADSPLTLISAQESAPARNWDGHVVGGGQIATPGPQTLSFTGGDDSGGHVIAAEFTPIPEASSALMLVLGGLLMGGYRRRKA